MGHGATNFGFMNGANHHNSSRYEATVTSYDYDAPISESGDLTPKFRAYRKVLERYADLPPFREPLQSRKIKIPPLH